MNVSAHKKLEYRFSASPSFSFPASLEIAYSLTGNLKPVVETGKYAWILPRAGDVGGHSEGGIVHYIIPIDGEFPAYFNIAPAEGGGNGINRMQIHSITFRERLFGFYHTRDSDGAGHIYISPFISKRSDDGAWVIEPPAAFAVPSGFFPEFAASVPDEKEFIIEADGRRFEVSPYLDWLIIPAGVIAHNVKQIIVPAAASSDTVNIDFYMAYVPPSAPQLLETDPGIILAWPQENWRDKRYEVFRWDRFPSLLIFDTADYAVQDKLFKRLAFFVEKTGFRGRLAHDDEIAELHGWNAHDYRAEDLARFFQTARNARFPLIAEERELERILFDAGIIVEFDGIINGGEGGVISISRESDEYLRYRFMAHEGFHGLFFIDEDFRDFSRGRWQQLPADAKRFIVSFFGFQQYDTADEYLLINEFMAHILQQPETQAGYYFGQALPSRLEDTWRKGHLPAKNEASGYWPTLAAAFTREAEAFSAYVNSRWGLSAGSVHLVRVR